MKKRYGQCIIIAVFFCIMTVGCTAGRFGVSMTEEEQDTTADDFVVIGFSQLGAESDWRNTNTKSMQDTFTEEKGYRLIYENGQQKQTNQIMAVRKFLQQDVDYIVLAPVTEEGWDNVLKEVKDAGIPMIFLDRRADVTIDYFTSWVGSDFALEARKVTTWLDEFAKARGIAPSQLHIVDIQGTLGASAQIGRTRVLEDAARKKGWDLLDEVSGDFTQARGREVMEEFLRKYDNLNVVYCENDNEALGAIEAIRNAGRVPGPDILNGEILVVSFDAVNEEAMQLVADGTIACIAECNPLQGPRVESVIRLLEAGETPEKSYYVDEAIYSALDEVERLVVNRTNYYVTRVGQ